MTHLTCLPQSVFSWNYTVTLADSDITALVELDFWGEQGSISFNSSYYRVQHSWLSKEWSLNLDDRIVAVAVKPNPVSRFFEISYDNQNLVLRAKSLWTRSFLIEQNDRLLGTIQPIHLHFTLGASIDCSSSITIPIQIFMFWLTVLMWKRAADASN